MLTIKRTDLPQRFRWISRKKSVMVSITHEGTDNFGTWWDGGSRRSLSYINVKTGKIGSADAIPTAGPFGGGAVVDIPMKEGYLILDCGDFCGKAATPHLFVHPDDVEFVVGQELVAE